MTKRLLSFLGLFVFAVLLTGSLTAAAPMATVPSVTFTLVSAPPATMHVGDTAALTVQVHSNTKFLYAQMLPTFHFPGRGLVAVQMGGVRVHGGTDATLSITFVAKGPTAGLAAEGVVCQDGTPSAGGVAPVAAVAGVRFQGGYVVTQRFPVAPEFYCVTVLP